MRALFESGFEFMTDWWWLLVPAVVGLASLVYWRVRAGRRPRISEMPRNLITDQAIVFDTRSHADLKGPKGGRLLRISAAQPEFPAGGSVGVNDRPRSPIIPQPIARQLSPQPEETIEIVIDLTALEADPAAPEAAIEVGAPGHKASFPADPWS